MTEQATPGPAEPSKATEAERMANIGRTIQLKKLGREVTVNEITMETIIKCTKELSYLLSIIDFSQKMDVGTLFAVFLGNDITLNAIRVLAAQSTKTTVEDWHDVGVGDWLKFILAIQAITDWEELKTLFTVAGITAMLQRLAPTQTNQSVPSDPTPVPTSE